MKKVTIKNANTNKLTAIVKQLMAMPYEKFTRRASQGSGDDVHVIFNKNTKFMIEFCTKTNTQTKENFVNWARVSGPDIAVTNFLLKIGFNEQSPNLRSGSFTAKL
jgi:hypothetical protein